MNARHLRVKAPYVELLSDRPYRDLERVDFSGRVYPYEDLRGKYLDYFAGLKNLKEVDGALCGKDGWYFEGCSSLEKVHLSNGIERVLSRAFKDCSSLTDLYIPDTVTEIGAYAFSGCTSLKTIHLPSDIRIIPKGAFEGCKSLKKVFLSDSIEVIEDDAFKGCSSMRKPWIPKAIKRISETAFDNPEWR